MDKALPVLAVLAAGLLIALQGPTNGMVSKATAAPLFAVFLSFSTGFAALALGMLVLSVRPSYGALAALPWYAWLGGLYGAVVVFCTAWATPKLGAGPSLVAALLAQTVLGITLDHLGVMGLDRQPITPLRVGGVLVMLVGAGMIASKR